MATSAKKSGDTIQIMILTLFMCTGFFLIVTIVLSFMIPGREAEVNAQIDDLESLRTAFNPKGELTRLRAQVNFLKEQAAEEGRRDLRGIVDGVLKSIGLEPKTFPQTDFRPVKGGSKTTEHTQTVDFDRVEVQQLLNFVARVKSERNTIRLHSMTMIRKRGPAAEEAVWGSKVVFKYFENEEFAKQVKAKAKKRAGREAANVE